MEGRRLAVICSHLGQVSPRRPASATGSGRPPPGGVHTSACEGSGGGTVPRSGMLGMGNCIFCMIVRGESPAFKLYEDDICLCILDSNPLTPGHSLIIPKSHYTSLKETPPLVVAAMCSIIPLLSNAIMKATKSDSFNLLANSGAAAGQVVFHTHLHIIPRNENDCLWRSESSQRKPLKQTHEAATLADEIREQLSFPDKRRPGSSSCGNHEEPKLSGDE